MTYYLLRLASRNEEVAFQVINLPFLDSIELEDSHNLEFLLGLQQSDPEGMGALLTHPEVLAGGEERRNRYLPLLYLEMKDPQRGEELVNLKWVIDGLDQFEIGSVRALQALALNSPKVYHAILDREREWLPPQTSLDMSVLKQIVELAASNEDAALLVIEIPLMESLTWESYETLERLVEFADYSPEILADILVAAGHGGGTGNEQAIEIALLLMELEDPEAVGLLRQIPWVKDGMAVRNRDKHKNYGEYLRSIESDVVQDLLRLLRRDRQAFLVLVTKPWLQEPFTPNTYLAYSRSMDLAAGNDPDLAAKVINMPFLDEVDINDHRSMTAILELGRESSSKAAQLVERLEAEGGLTDQNHFTVHYLYLELARPDAWEQVEALPWVEDGIDRSEEPGARALIYSALDARQVFSEVIQKNWIRDGVNKSEITVVENLSHWEEQSRGRRAEAEAISLLEMPFLESVSASDAAAIDTLNGLLWGGRGEQGFLPEVLYHPSLDGGITDEDAVMLGVLRPFANRGSPVIWEILSAGDNWGVHRKVELPYSGTIHLAVLDRSEGRRATLDLLEETIREMEEFMMTPFPVSFAGITVTVTGSFGGPYGFISLDPADAEDGEMIARLVSHTYWSAYPTWVHEGTAEFLGKVVAGDFPDNNGQPLALPCDLAQNLGELEGLQNDARGPDARSRDGGPEALRRIRSSECQWSLPLGLYVDLYEKLGDEAFRKGFRGTYLALENADGNLWCPSPTRGYCLLREGFVSNASPASATAAEEVIDHWYYGDPLGKNK